MRRDVAALLVLLVASNGAWAWVAFGRDSALPRLDSPQGGEPRSGPSAPGPVLQGTKPEPEPIEKLTQGGVNQGRDPELTKRRVALANAIEEERKAKARAARIAEEDFETIVADLQQIEDAERRERALTRLGNAIASPDANVARAGLRKVVGVRVLRGNTAIGKAIRARLDDAELEVVGAAAYALLTVGPEPGDLDRLLARAEASSPPRFELLHVCMMLSRERVEGRLAALFVRAMESKDEPDGPRRVENTANLLRGVWVTPEVEDAVVAAAKRLGGNPPSRMWP
jgi:hypothetical protein